MTNEPSRSVSHKILWNRPGRLSICGISGRKNVTKILRFLSKIKDRKMDKKRNGSIVVEHSTKITGKWPEVGKC